MEKTPDPETQVRLPVKRRLVSTRTLDAGETAKQKMPPLSTVLGNASSAAVRALGAKLRGHKLRRSDEETARIQDLCRSNVCGRWDAERGRCAECGCYGAWKARLLTEKCPLGHWG